MLINGFSATQLASDTAHRANENPLNPAVWSVPSFSPNSNQIVNLEFEPPAGGDGVNLWQTSSGWGPDQFVSVQLDAATDDDAFVDLYLRTTSFGLDDFNTYICGVEGPLSSGIGYIFVIIHGVATFVIHSAPLSFSVGDKITAGVFGKTLFLMRNNTVLLSITDEQIANGSAGFGLSDTVPSDIQVSNFTGGILTAVGPAAITVDPNYKTDITQKRVRINGTLSVTGATYPAGGIALDSVLLALPEAMTNSGVRRCICTSLLGSGFIYQRQSNGKLMILRVPPNGSLTTAAPLQEFSNSDSLRPINDDVIDFEAEFLRNS
jgi:hypothetical protein